MNEKTVVNLLTSFLVVSFIFVNFNLPTISATPALIPEENSTITTLLNELNVSNIMHNIWIFSSFGSRVTGYSGCDEAAQHIINQFKGFGLSVEVQEYPILIPMDHGANITVPSTGEVFKAYPLWPNMVQCSPTPREGISGPLVYVGSGDLEDFDGKRIEGSIVLMDFNSFYNWLNAAKLGAKAVIFIEPEETVRMEAESKVILTPIYFPRVYVSRDVGERLRILAKENTVVTLRSSMRFEWRTGKNIIGVLEGERDDEIIILAAHYDSWSPVPSKAPGAFDAIQISTLLEIARVLSAHKPKRTLWFLALSGHYQNVMGAREFVEKYYFQNQTYHSGQKKILAFIDLELASDGNLLTWDYILDAFAISSQETFSNLLLQKYIPDASEVLNLPIKKYVLPEYLRDPFEISFFSPSFDSEPVSCSASLALSFITMKTLKPKFLIPTNEADKIELTDEFVNTQIKFIMYVAYRLANDDLTRYENLNWRPALRQFSPPAGGGSAGAGLITLEGQVVTFNYSTGFYSPVPNALVVLHRYSGGLGHETPSDQERHHPLWGIIITKADENGRFVVHGLEHWMTGQASAYRFNILAFVVDPSTGQITYAPELGVYGGGGGIFAGYQFLGVQFDRHPYILKTVVFRCKSLTIYDTYDAFNILSPRKRVNLIGQLQQDLPSIVINEFNSHTPPLSWGMISPQDTGEPLAIIFVPPEIKFEVLLVGHIGGADYPCGILNNASETIPSGTGLCLQKESEALPYTGFRFFECLYWIANERYLILRSYHIYDQLSDRWHHGSLEIFKSALDAFSKYRYSEAYDTLYDAWNMEANAYRRITEMTKDTVNTSSTFYLVLFPFAFSLEALLFGGRGKKRLITIVATFVIFILVAYLIHPGFRLSFNVSGVFLGLSMFAAVGIVVFILVIEALSFGKRLRAILTGQHYSEISRTGALLAAFSVGIHNMRKRKLRTILTITSIVLLTFSFVALTSASFLPYIRIDQKSGVTPYNGALFIKHGGMEPFTIDYYYYIKSIFPGGKIVPRVWYFPPVPRAAQQTLNPLPQCKIYSANHSCTLNAVLGLSPEELNLTKINSAIIEGRWFIKNERFAIILPKPVAESLSVKVGDEVSLSGLTFRVIGIMDDSMLMSITDLDQQPIFPRYVTSGQKGVQKNVIYPQRFVIVPYKTAIHSLDGQIYTIALKSENETLLKEGAQRIVRGSWGLYEITVGYNNSILTYRVGSTYVVYGSSFLIVPFAITSLVLCITVLGSIYERVREIAIYAAIGLSPLHVIAMFTAETLIYAIIGGVVGYLSGTGALDLFLIMGTFPPDINFNMASSTVFVAVGISFFSTLLAIIYPFFKVGRMVTPSLERKWKIKTRPRGDEWAIPLPFTCNTPEEARGIMMFMKEFLSIHLSPEVGVFWVRENVKLKEIIDKERNIQRIILLAPISLPPWDSGFIEEFQLAATKIGDKPFAFEVFLRYLSGERYPWEDSNPAFVDAIRKQLLLWKGIPQKERDRYIREGAVAEISSG